MSELIVSANDLLDHEIKHDDSISLKSIRKKELGFTFILLGLAERQAKNISKLVEVMDVLEEEIFNPLVLENLETTEQIELHKYANELLGKSTKYIATVRDSINWDELEVQLASVQDLSKLDSDDDITNRKDVGKMATSLLLEYGKSVSNKAG